MKKTFILLMIVAALGMMGCDRNPQTEQRQASLAECDMAIFENGKVTLYNSSTNTLTPLDAENDYVINGVFLGDNEFYYTTAVDGELYLKKIDLSATKPAPVMLADWDLKLSDCYVDSCGRCASMYGYAKVPMVGIEHGIGEMSCVFEDMRYYMLNGEKVIEGWPEDVTTDVADAQFLNDNNLFEQVNMETEGEGEPKNYYYYAPDDSGEHRVCLSDKIDFHADKYEDWPYEPMFQLLSVSPDRKGVAYAAIMEFGRGGHGPLCFATLDGKVQALLANDANFGWLNDSRLAYSCEEGIMAISPDMTQEKISSAQMFVTKY